MTESRRKGSLPANVHKIILSLLRFVLPLAALAYLVHALHGMPPGMHRLWLSSLQLNASSLLLLSLLLVLATLNWLLEAVKWKLLTAGLEAISLTTAFRGILYGVCLGFVTPKRSGEIAGRAMVLRSGNRISGMLVNTPGSLVQLGVTLVGGLISLFLVLSRWGSSPNPFPGTDAMSGTTLLLFPVAALALLTLLFVFAKPGLRWFLSRPASPAWSQKAVVLLDIGGKKLLVLVFLSVCRYLLFMLQFYLLLRLFQSPLPIQDCFVLLSVTYLVLAAVPLSALGEAGVRGAVVLLASGWITPGNLPPMMETGLVAGVMGLWLINLVIPALAGGALALAGGVPLNLRRALA